MEGNAEHVPLPDASFDLAISEYGACLWADPYKWVPEAARLLRPGGRLIFLTNSTSADALHRPTRPTPRPERPARARLLRHAPLRVARRGFGRVPPGLGRLGAAARGERVRGRGPDLEVRPRADARCTRSSSKRSSRWNGRGAGRARRSGRRARPAERAGRRPRGAQPAPPPTLPPPRASGTLEQVCTIRTHKTHSLRTRGPATPQASRRRASSPGRSRAAATSPACTAAPRRSTARTRVS